jgi:hypothetical protein
MRRLSCRIVIASIEVLARIEELASLRSATRRKNDSAKNDETSHEVTEPIADAA